MQNNKVGLEEHSDEELMLLYQKGDFMAFEILYTRHSPRVFEYLKTKVSPEIAQELLQDTFEKLHKSRSSYNNKYPFLPWLFTISRNSAMDFYKKAETKVSQKSKSDSLLLDSIAADTAEIFSAADASDILSGLPPQQRRILELRYHEEWSFRKIATELQTSEENARQLVSRTIKRLRSSLKKRGSL